METSQEYGTPGAPEPIASGEPGGEVRGPQTAEERRRAEARQRLEKKRGWQSGFVAYVVVNAFLVGIWFLTGRGYFWPAWVLGGWGLGMVLSYWDIFVRRGITEADIEKELGRG